MTRFGILNIFWFGLFPENDTLDVGFYHSVADDERVRDLIAFADLQVLALVEIVDVKRLEAILATLPGRWRARDPNQEAVASKAPGAIADTLQRVVFAWNDADIELIHWGRPIHEGPRAPVVARIRHRTNSFEATIIGIHPKSGNPIGWQNQPKTSTDHIAGERPGSLFPSPGSLKTSRQCPVSATALG